MQDYCHAIHSLPAAVAVVELTNLVDLQQWNARVVVVVLLVALHLRTNNTSYITFTIIIFFYYWFIGPL
jgi:hypothetical protein